MAERVEWTREAIEDLAGIEAVLAHRNRLEAQRWVHRLVMHAARAAVLPYAARAVPELGDAAVRQLVVREHRIIFRVLGERIRVLRVIHARRRAGGR